MYSVFVELASETALRVELLCGVSSLQREQAKLRAATPDVVVATPGPCSPTPFRVSICAGLALLTP